VRQPGPGDDAKLLRFPTDYPIKVLGRPSEEFRSRVRAIFMKHVPVIQTDRITERLSANGNFLAISYVIRAQSREQVTALANELTACEGVLMLL
jgi:uncharacterized protein